MKKTLSIFVCIVAVLSFTTGCEKYYGKDEAKKDMIEYLNKKYNKSFDVNITKTYACSGGIGTCEFYGEAYINGDSSKKCEVTELYEKFSDNCDTIVK